VGNLLGLSFSVYTCLIKNKACSAAHNIRKTKGGCNMSEKDKYNDCSCTDASGNNRNSSGKNSAGSKDSSLNGGSVSNGFKPADYVSGDSAGSSSSRQYSKTGSGRINQGDRINFGDGNNQGDKL
jgi:hypothetical protein